MILLALALAQAQVTPPSDDIVVIAERLKRIAVSVSRDRRGKLGCSLSDSSGSERLDRALCRAATRCVRQGDAGEAVAACVERRKPMLLADLRAEMARRR